MILESGDCHCGLKGDWNPGVKTHGLLNLNAEAQNEARRRGNSLYGEHLDSWRDAEVSILAGAYYMSRLQNILPDTFNPYYSQEELIRLGYNVGKDTMMRVALADRPMNHNISGDIPDLVQAFDVAWDQANNMICNNSYIAC
jgi:hypothetical protein